jgi:hypothetical protein
MRVTTIIAAAMVLAVPAMAEEHHTVSWYRAHPAEMEAKLAACKDDPGYAAHDPNCENAHEARIGQSVDEARAQVGLMQKQEDQRQQRLMMANPQYLLNRLRQCNAIPSPAVREINDCPLVYATAKQYLTANGHQP